MTRQGTGVAALIGFAGLAFGGAAWAETVSTMSRASLFRSQIEVLDGRAAQQYNDSIRLQPPSVEVPPLPGMAAPAYDGRTDSQWIETARAAARMHGVPEDLFLRLVRQESGWPMGAVSPKGAIGLAQLMPDTARLLGVDPRDPGQNLEGGARYLRIQFDRFGTWDLALAAYNAGPEAVVQYGVVPPYPETRGYVRAIWGG